MENRKNGTEAVVKLVVSKEIKSKLIKTAQAIIQGSGSCEKADCSFCPVKWAGKCPEAHSQLIFRYQEAAKFLNENT
jgi:hypothetical protein